MKTQRQPKLEEIENKLYRLWTNRDERARFLEGEIDTACHQSCEQTGKAGAAAGAMANEGETSLLRQIDPNGVKLYSSLIEIGRMDLMSSIYPVIEELVGKQFRSLVFDYFESLPPVHFNLNQSASRFGQFLSGQEKLVERYPFILELADYEWIELAVLEDPAVDLKYEAPIENNQIDAADFAALSPVINNVFVGRRYRYAIPTLVEEISAGKKLPRRVKESPTCVIVYRDPDSLDARFLELDEVSLSILEAVRQSPQITYGQLITDICSQPRFSSESALSDCLEAIEQLRELKLIVAERSNSSQKSSSQKSSSRKSSSQKSGSQKVSSQNTSSQKENSSASAKKTAKK